LDARCRGRLTFNTLLTIKAALERPFLCDLTSKPFICDKSNIAVFPADLGKVYIMFNSSDFTIITNDKIKEFNLLCNIQMSDLLDFDSAFSKEFLEGLDYA